MSTSNSSPYSSESSQNSPYYPPSNGSQGYSMYQPNTPEHSQSPSYNHYAVPSADLSVGHRKTRLIILAQPQPKFRFRYQSEMIGTHGCLMAETSNTAQNRKSYIRVQLDGYAGREAVIRCSLVTNSFNDPQPHVHKLIGENSSASGSENSEYYDVTVSALKDDWTATFTGLTIIHTGKKQVREVLERRMLSEALTKFRKEFPEAKSLPAASEKQVKDNADYIGNHMDLHCVRLKFEAFTKDGAVPLCDPVYSNPIHNLKSTQAADLRIVRVDKVVSSCAGQEEVFIFVEKVNKKDIKVKFFQLSEDDKETWVAFADFTELDVHHQYAIAFKTPPYHDQNIKEDVSVFFQLFRPSNNAVSEPRSFTYKPREDMPRKRRQEVGAFNGGRSEAKRLHFFPNSPSRSDGSGSNSSKPGNLTGNGSNSSGEASDALAPGSQLQYVLQAQPSMPFQQAPIQNFASGAETRGQMTNRWLPPAAAPSQSHEGHFIPIYTAVPQVLERGIAQPGHHQQYNTSGLQQQQQEQEASFTLMDNQLAQFLQEPQQHWQQPQPHLPAQLDMEPVPAEQLQTTDPFLSGLLSLPSNFSFDFEDYVVPDAVKVNSSSAVEEVTDKLIEFNLKDNEREPAKSKGSSLDELSAMEVGRLLSLNFGGALRDFAATGDISGLLRSNVYLLALQSEDGDNALHCALWNNQLDVFHVMLNAAKSHKASWDLINAQNDLNLTPLHFAVIMNNAEAVAALMAAGADPSIADRQGDTPVHVCAKDPDLLPILRIILPSSSQKNPEVRRKLDSLNYDGMTPLHLAVISGSLEAVQLLTEAGASVNAIETKTGRGPLHIAIEKKSESIINHLLSRPSVDVNLRSYDGSTLLHVAVMEGLDQVCRTLCQKKADPQMKSFVSVFGRGSGRDAEADSDSESGDTTREDDTEDDDEKGRSTKSGISPLELARQNPEILEILKSATRTSDGAPVELVTTDCVKGTSFAEAKDPGGDSGYDIMASKELGPRDLDDSVIRRLADILESASADNWKKLASALDLPQTLLTTVERQKSPVTYILQNLEVWDVTPQLVLDKLTELKFPGAVRILEDHLNS